MINDYAIKRECDWKKTCACGNDSGYVLCSVISLLQTVDQLIKTGKKLCCYCVTALMRRFIFTVFANYI